eukprot:gb/GEZN01005008.1/.p1 GENE.gb/GEZN01005008.1/~~gb/GEZN01005008.1/.p1  ORF type:complete len:411 (-),score=94.78 gb/GEZN01005008.1/:357-1589(-)
MAKHGGFLTPKAIANRIKSKGLQKLRWYCEMCQKQCRDENGFKCHTTSESHQRQMMVFRDNPQQFMEEFSVEFEEQYMEILRRRGTTRVKANALYQEHVSDRAHVHMNSTKWDTLTSFLTYLGKKGVAEVDCTPKGWYIKYIDRGLIEERERIAKREAAALDSEQRHAKVLQEQIKLAKQHEEDSGLGPKEVAPTEITGEIGKIELSVTKRSLNSSSNSLSSSSSSSEGGSKRKERTLEKSAIKKQRMFADDMDDRNSATVKQEHSMKKKKSSAIEELMRESEEEKLRYVKRQDNWLAKDIVVKVMNKVVGDGAYYKKKGTVVKLHDKYVAEVKMLDTGHILKIDQEQLQNVVPNIGRKVLVVNGGYRGAEATMLALNDEQLTVTVKIETGMWKGKTVSNLEIEDVCKLA